MLKKHWVSDLESGNVTIPWDGMPVSLVSSQRPIASG